MFKPVFKKEEISRTVEYLSVNVFFSLWLSIWVYKMLARYFHKYLSSFVCYDEGKQQKEKSFLNFCCSWIRQMQNSRSIEYIRKIAGWKMQPTTNSTNGRIKERKKNAHIISDETTNLYALAFNWNKTPKPMKHMMF